jgi:hypothetical protein
VVTVDLSHEIDEDVWVYSDELCELEHFIGTVVVVWVLFPGEQL